MVPPYTEESTLKGFKAQLTANEEYYSAWLSTE